MPQQYMTQLGFPHSCIVCFNLKISLIFFFFFFLYNLFWQQFAFILSDIDKLVFLLKFRQEYLDTLYRYAKFQYECGNYSGAAEYLYFFRVLVSFQLLSLTFNTS